jgi:hypothetical protein
LCLFARLGGHCRNKFEETLSIFSSLRRGDIASIKCLGETLISLMGDSFEWKMIISISDKVFLNLVDFEG